MHNINPLREVFLDEVVELNPSSLGINTPANHSFTYLDLKTVKQGVINWKEAQLTTFSSAPLRARRKVSKKDCIFGTVRPSQRSHGYIDELIKGNVVVSTGFTVLRARPELLDSRYLFHWLISDIALRQAEAVAVGSNYPAVNEGDIRRFKLVLPSMNEQRKIAEILDSIDSKIKATELIARKLTALREGLISQALDRIQGKKVKENNLSLLTKVANISSGVTLGLEPAGPGSIELPYLRVANVQDGYIDTSDIKNLRIMRSDLPKYLLMKGDVLLTEGGDFDKLGRGAVWDGRIAECISQNHIFRVRCDKDHLMPEFLAAYISSPYGKRYFLSIAKQTTNLATINSTQLKAMPIPLPSLTEQKELVNILEAHTLRMGTEEGQLRQLLIIKQGLMNDLLTGRIRASLIS